MLTVRMPREMTPWHFFFTNCQKISNGIFLDYLITNNKLKKHIYNERKYQTFSRQSTC